MFQYIDIAFHNSEFQIVDLHRITDRQMENFPLYILDVIFNYKFNKANI